MSIADSIHLDMEALLTPGAGSRPVEEPVPLALRQELDQARRPPGSRNGGKDRGRVSASAWEEIVAKAGGRMAEGVRDLGLAARLIEALTRLNGFAGLGDGLHLTRRLVEECWDELTPRPGADGDLGPLLAPLRWIDDPDRGALFPHTVRAVPFLHRGDQNYSWIDWKQLRDRGDKPAWAAFERALQATPRAELEAYLDELEQARCEVERLSAALSSHSAEPFEMAALWRAIEDCRSLLELLLQHLPAPAIVPAHDVDVADPEQPAFWAGGDDAVGFTQTQLRDRIYAQIEQLAVTLERLEPHSPVPHLLMRAVHLGAMPFPQLMAELLRDPNVLGRMNQELGIRPNA
jgi:type VI secretion system protein ImpA